jgi:glycosyltransferase involved in cell wall biosynthesis
VKFLVGLPHTRLEARYSTCAYTQKIRKFIAMGWDDLLVYHGGSELVDPEELPDWPNDDQWDSFNRWVINQLRETAADGDTLLLAGGASQLAIAEAFPNMLICEPGVGYPGVTGHHAAFESYAWMHYVYGQQGWNDGRLFDTVIPNYFDLADWPTIHNPDGDYLLFVGRLIDRKGPQVAVELARRVGMRLVIAGPGDPSSFDAEYAGVVREADLAELMGNAACVICPTLYIEPFGGVAVEAMLCGTPVVASDFGAFTETVREGVGGYRFNTLLEGETAIRAAMQLPREHVRAYAAATYSLEAIRPKFDMWFDRLATLWEAGYYAEAAAV